MDKFRYVIIGGGVVAGYAAKEFAEHDQYQTGDLAIITADETIPYDRPPLSKTLLQGKEELRDIVINELQFYQAKGIHIFVETIAKQLDIEKKQIVTDQDQVIQYERLLIATGSEPNKLEIPGSDSSRVKYLRSLEDAYDIRERIGNSEHVLVIGGGYIGMETAASIASQGVQVTMAFPEGRLLERLFTLELSTLFEDYYQERDVNIRIGVKPLKFEERDYAITTHFDNGTILSSDFVIVGIGVTPRLELVRDTAIDIFEDGIKVNEYLQSTIPTIYAAGDIVSYYDSIGEKQRRVEHWQNAVDTGRYVARHMLGVEANPFETLRYFFSDIFDLSYEFWGDTDDADEIIHIGDFAQKNMGVWWLKDDRLIGAFLMNRPEEEAKKAQEWIKSKQLISPDTLKMTLSELEHSS